MKKIVKLWVLAGLAIVLFGCTGTTETTENTNIYSTAPAGAVILFDGSDFSQWTNCDGGEVRWKIVDGIMEVVGDSVWGCDRIQGTMTKYQFKDFQLHLDFKLPEHENTNSGVYIQKRYELQIYNSFNVKVSPGMGGAIYRQKVPDVNVGKPNGEWESYDIVFRSARFDNSEPEQKIENARITVIQNGIVIHNNVIIKSKTGVGFPEGSAPGPIMLQDHLAAVQFRNIWIVPNIPIETLPEGDH
jgi:hypothetical protein